MKESRANILVPQFKERNLDYVATELVASPQTLAYVEYSVGDIRFCMRGTQVRKVSSTRWGLGVSLAINIHGTWLCIISPLCIVE